MGSRSETAVLMGRSFVVVGGGAAGVHCARELCRLAASAQEEDEVVLISKMFVSRYVCAFVVCLVERRRPRVVGCCVNADNGAFCRKLLLLERKCQKQGWKKWM